MERSSVKTIDSDKNMYSEALEILDPEATGSIDIEEMVSIT